MMSSPLQEHPGCGRKGPTRVTRNNAQVVQGFYVAGVAKVVQGLRVAGVTQLVQGLPVAGVTQVVQGLRVAGVAQVGAAT